jgi:hypothetical protein
MLFESLGVERATAFIKEAETAAESGQQALMELMTKAKKTIGRRYLGALYQARFSERKTPTVANRTEGKNIPAIAKTAVNNWRFHHAAETAIEDFFTWARTVETNGQQHNLNDAEIVAIR